VGRLIVDALFRMRSRYGGSRTRTRLVLLERVACRSHLWRASTSDSSTWNTSPDFDTSNPANTVALRKLFLDTIYDVTNTFNIAGYAHAAASHRALPDLRPQLTN
jgi:hypothetical protein